MYPVMGVLLISAAAIADIKVTQNPEIIEVIEGGKFQISCTFTTSIMQSVFGFRWYKQAFGGEKSWITNTSDGFVGRVLQTRGQASKNNNITIVEANRNDSGIYYCQVDVLQIDKGTGSGTRVTIKDSPGQIKSEEASTPKLIILTSALVVTTLVLVLFAILILLNRNKCQDRTPTTRNDVQGGTSNNVIYADLRIAKPKRQRPGNRTNNHAAGPPPQRGEDEVVYAVMRPSRDKNKNQAPVRPRNQMEDPVVYGVVRAPARQ